MLAAEGPTKNLGCVMCGQPGVVLPGVVDVAGTYTAWFCYAGTEVAFTFELEEGDTMVVPLGTLGAPYTYAFHVELPEGAGVWAGEVDGVEFQRWIICLKVPLVGEVVLLDMESITCENLTDAENGLTDAQVITCILPLVDFADDAYWDALSVQQIADITARLGPSMDTIIPYADEAAALVDGALIPDEKQTVRIKDTGREYPGDGTSMIAQLIVADRFFLPRAVDTETWDNADGLVITKGGNTYTHQLNG